MNQLQNITDNLDGYTMVEPERQEEFQKIYFWKQDEQNILFPFIYKKLNKDVFLQKCILMIKKNEIIEIKDEEKVLVSL